MKKFGSLFAMVALAACGGSGSSTPPPTDTAAPAQDTMVVTTKAAAPVTTEYQTKTGKTWVVTEVKTSASLSDLHISSKGFAATNDSVKIEGSDPLETVLQADLNKDGFEEVYLITRSTGSGSGATIHGFSSNKDKSFSGIHVQEVTDKDVAKGGKFEGYMGHDSIYVQGNMLARQFPVYKEGDANAGPTGGKRTIYYALKPGEATWQLTVSSAAQSK